MRTDNELQQMSHDELIEQVKGLQFQLAGSINCYVDN